MWAVYMHESRKRGQPATGAVHVRKDSAMDAHLAQVALSGLKLTTVEVEEEDLQSLRNQNWLDAAPKAGRGNSLAGQGSLESQGSAPIEAHNPAAGVDYVAAMGGGREKSLRGCRATGGRQFAYLGSLEQQVPVHLASSYAEKLAGSAFSKSAEGPGPQEEEVEEPWETSPERIRNPRDRPRRRDIKPSTRRNLTGAFRRVSGPSYGGVNTGLVALPASGVFDFDSARSRSIFDWSAFSYGSRKQADEDSRSSVSTRDGQSPPELLQRSNSSSPGKRPVTTAGSGSGSSTALNDSGWTSSGSSSSDEIGRSSVHPNDSCIDYHDESTIQLDASSSRANSTVLSIPTVPLPVAMEIRRTPFSAEEIIIVAKHISLALCELHGQDVVHRQVTPDMILVDDPHNVSAALLQESPHAAVLTDSTRFLDNKQVGSAAFAPPEVGRSCRGCVPYSPAGDMWGLGVTLVMMAMPTAECGPFGRSGFKPLCPRPNPPVNSNIDDLQEWISERLSTFMNCADPATEACQGVPAQVQALAHMLLRADPAQRASAGYMVSRQWVFCSAPAPIPVERYVMSESFTPSSSQSIDNVSTPQSLRMRASRSNSTMITAADLEDATDVLGEEKDKHRNLPGKNRRASHCECFVTVSKVASEMLNSGISKKHEDPGGSIWNAVAGLFCGKS
mmetsp:Transcript_12027/g.33822  ORF Transcript_12027/g.33822 Transcript_12027/m.33822 type:complete len:674 (+) Transcript_12027:332-2353(+)